jgi:AcrR family transcriptional regulator
MTLNNGEHYVGERAKIEERRTRVMELRVQGYSLRQIAAEVGVALRTVQDDVEAVFLKLNEQQLKNAQIWRAIHMQRTEAIWKPIFERFNEPNSLGKPRADVKDAEALLKTLERQAKLLGLDITAKMDINLLSRVLSLLEANGQNPKNFFTSLMDELMGRPSDVLPEGIEAFPSGELEVFDE